MPGDVRRMRRRLGDIESEIEYCQGRIGRFQDRVTELTRRRDELRAELGIGSEAGAGARRTNPAAADPPGEGNGDPVAGALGDLNLDPAALATIGQMLQGVDLNGLLGAVAGGLGSSGGLGALGGLLGGVGGASAGSGGNVLDGVMEVANYITQNPLKGKKWSAADIGPVLGLASSPNVRAMIQTGRDLVGRFGGHGGSGSPGGGQAALPAPSVGHGSEAARTAADGAGETQIRLSRRQGSVRPLLPV